MKGLMIRAFVAAACLIMLASCHVEQNDSGKGMAHQLFAKSVSLVKVYTDSIGSVNDSASFNRMREDFDEKMAKINFQFPPDTDLNMTEEENDSLIKMLDRLVKIIREKREAFEIQENADSVLKAEVDSARIKKRHILSLV